MLDFMWLSSAKHIFYYFFFLMIRPPPRSPLFPDPPPSRSSSSNASVAPRPAWRIDSAPCRCPFSRAVRAARGPLRKTRGTCWTSSRCGVRGWKTCWRSEEHTSELQSQSNLVCRVLLEKKILEESGLNVESEKFVYAHENFYTLRRIATHDIGFHFPFHLYSALQSQDSKVYFPHMSTQL